MLSTNSGEMGLSRLLRKPVYLSPQCRNFLCVLVIAIACCGCSENKSPAPSAPSAGLQPAVNWLIGHYRRVPPGKGWHVTSVTSQGAQVQIMVDIPAEQASGIMRQPADDQFREVANQVCPSRGEDFWNLLPAGSSVKVLPSVTGQVFIEVDCVK